MMRLSLLRGFEFRQRDRDAGLASPFGLLSYASLVVSRGSKIPIDAPRIGPSHGLTPTLALLDQGQNGGNCVFEARDLADDGRRGQPRLPCRILDQGVLRLLETVEQRSEVSGRGVHASPAMTGAPPPSQP